MSPKRYAVTGARGFLGAACCEMLQGRGHGIQKLVRGAIGPGESTFVLGEAVSPQVLEGVDVLVHAAHDFGAGAGDRNIVGSERLFEAARAASVGRIVFVSSVSAHAGCRSEYGRGKLRLERVVAGLGGSSLRPGLIWGRPGKGMFAALERVTRLPVVPVFDRGTQPLRLAHVDDVAAAIIALGEHEHPHVDRVLIAAHPRVWLFRDLLMELARRRRRSVRRVSVPSGLALLGMRSLEAAGVRLPFRSDSLVSLLNPDPELDFAMGDDLGLLFRDFAGAASAED